MPRYLQPTLGLLPKMSSEGVAIGRLYDNLMMIAIYAVVNCKIVVRKTPRTEPVVVYADPRLIESPVQFVTESFH